MTITTLYIISGVLVAFILFLVYIVYNLLMKVEKYEDVTVDQTKYLQRVSELIRDSKMHLQKLMRKGFFKAMMRSVIFLIQ